MSLRRTGPPKRKTRIKPVSDKLAARLPEYRKARDRVRQRANGRCELRTPVCKGQGVEPHHLKGRTGDLLTNVMLLRWVCAECHKYAHANPELAYRKGWLIRKNGLGNA